VRPFVLKLLTITVAMTSFGFLPAEEVNLPAISEHELNEKNI
jgi:hypothetical protein